MNAIVVLAIGDKCEKMLVITKSLLAHYAEKCDAELVIIREAKIGAGSNIFEKLQLFDYLGIYERILYLDADIIITPKCQSLFDLVPPTSMGVYYPLPRDRGITKVADGTLMDEIARVQHSLGDIGWTSPYPYFNAGLMVLAAEHRLIFDPALPIQRGLCFVDQTLLNYRVQKYKIPLYNIGLKYNHCLAINRSKLMFSRRFRSDIIHYAGFERFYPEKSVVTMMREDAEVINGQARKVSQTRLTKS